MSRTKMVKVLILSDTHNFDKEAADPCPLKNPMPRVDVVLHCGDLTYVGGADHYKQALRLLGNFDAELKLVIAGNHDISLDSSYTGSRGPQNDRLAEHREAVETMTGVHAQAANVTYLTEGAHSFTLRNGTRLKIFASPYQPEYNDWAFQYKRGAARWSIPRDVDIVMTHAPPYGVMDAAGSTKRSRGCEMLLQEVQRVKPLLHCFGHIHDGYGVDVKPWVWGSEAAVERIVQIGQAGTEEPLEEMRVVKGESTLMVNAAIMDAGHRPVNAPWVVELPIMQ